jgi:hypothetical protein
MSWLARLKNQQAFVQRATKTTETVFVVSVGASTGHLKKKGTLWTQRTTLSPTQIGIAGHAPQR